MRTLRVGGKEHREITGASSQKYSGDLDLKVLGCVTTVVGKADRKRSWVTHALGNAELSSLDQTILASDKEVLIRVGTSSIRMSPEGIEINLPSISVSGGGAGLVASGDKLKVRAKKDAELWWERNWSSSLRALR